MSFIQKLGFGRCTPLHQYHTLLTAFPNPKLTTFRDALQQYADSFNAIEVDEHWLALRDRYLGQDWAKRGILKDFEDLANGLGQKLMWEYVKVRSPDEMPTIKQWRTQSVFGFRHSAISEDYPDWLKTTDADFIEVRGQRVLAGHFDVLAQFKFLWLAGAVKSKKDRGMLVGLRVSEGR